MEMVASLFDYFEYPNWNNFLKTLTLGVILSFTLIAAWSTFKMSQISELKIQPILEFSVLDCVVPYTRYKAILTIKSGRRQYLISSIKGKNGRIAFEDSKLKKEVYVHTVVPPCMVDPITFEFDFVPYKVGEQEVGTIVVHFQGREKQEVSVFLPSTQPQGTKRTEQSI